MEVLGTYAPLVKEGVKEIRLRFSRVKFWLGVGAELSKNIRPILAEAGIIPAPPPLYGRRVGLKQEQEKQKIEEEREMVHSAALEEFEKLRKLRNGVFIK